MLAEKFAEATGADINLSPEVSLYSFFIRQSATSLGAVPEMSMQGNVGGHTRIGRDNR